MAKLDDACCKAAALITGERNQVYGSPAESFGRIALLWSAYLKREVSPQDVGMLLILMKVSRERSVHQEDNLVDICGYASLVNYLHEFTLPQAPVARGPVSQKPSNSE